ncbi:MAG: hypothetical protein WCR52_07325 [Bacteroidota bacterium]
MKKFKLLYIIAFLAINHAQAQCPVIQNCPVQPLIVCDSSTNNPLLWKNTAFKDSLHGIQDLFETAYLPEITVIDPCHPTDRRISYVLLLDLNGDGVQETAVWSDSLPPNNRVMMGNAGNPNYSGGTPVAFDNRGVLLDEQYRFALEQVASGDTLKARVRWVTNAAPLNYIIPQIPGGRCKIRWFIESGGVKDTCEQVFTVKDCKAPSVSCISGLSVNLLYNGQVQVWAGDFLSDIEDNDTPANQTRIGLIEQEFSTVFPVDAYGTPKTSVVFTCQTLGQRTLVLWAKDKSGNTNHCDALITVKDPNWTCGDPIILNTCIQTELEQYIGRVKIPLASGIIETPSLGCRSYIASEYEFDLVPYKEDNPTNGISTFDLLLISKHILGVQQLSSPYKMIAADINKSNSITTFDVIELRKLILGIYTDFPNNKSWRFIPKNTVFPNPANAFQAPFEEKIHINAGIAPSFSQFIGIKIGDVNNTAIPDSLTASDTRAAIPVVIPDIALNAGETIDIPIEVLDPAQWNGFQMDLQYDENQLVVEQVLPGDLPEMDANSFALHRGSVRCSWWNVAPQAVFPGSPLFRLRVRAQEALRLRDVLRLNNAQLKAEAYDEADQPQAPLSLEFRAPVETPDESTVFAPQPNPTKAGTTFPILLTSDARVHLDLFDSTGKAVYQVDVEANVGNLMLEVPAHAMPGTGLYFWKMEVGGNLWNGKLVVVK